MDGGRDADGGTTAKNRRTTMAISPLRGKWQNARGVERVIARLRGSDMRSWKPRASSILSLSFSVMWLDLDKGGGKCEQETAGGFQPFSGGDSYRRAR